ncbi:Protein SYS1 [Colletotrichum tropicale]|nr:Protein SYS1 [Colletotrichum tropicale]
MPRRRKPPRPGALGELPPLRIASQIAALQGLYYAGALVLMLFTALVAGTRFSMELVFGWEAVRGDTTQGWLSAFVWVLDGGLCMAVAIIVLIGRSKLVPDFALTMHGLHLVVSSLYTGRVPRNMMWWGAMASSSAICVALAHVTINHRKEVGLHMAIFKGQVENTTARFEVEVEERATKIWNSAFDELMKKEDMKAIYDEFSMEVQKRLRLYDSASPTTSRKSNAASLASYMDRILKAAQKKDTLKTNTLSVLQTVGGLGSVVGAILTVCPPAAIAWTGICAVIPIISKPMKEDENMIEGLKYICNNAHAYFVLPQQVICDEETSIRRLISYDLVFGRKVSTLYKLVLEYIILSVHSIPRTSGRAFKAFVGQAPWKDLLTRIQNAEDSLYREANIFKQSLTLFVLKSFANNVGERMKKAEEGRDAKERRKLLESLQGSECDFMDAFKATETRAAGTCRWFRRQPGFKHWLECDGGLLVVSGGTGCGKSVLAKYLIEEFFPARHPKSTICYYFFGHEIQPGNLKDAAAALLHCLLSSNEPLADDWKDKISRSQSTGFHRMWNYFAQASIDPLAGPVICVIDGVDDISVDKDNKQLLGTFIREIDAYLTTGPKNRKAKFIITTRGSPSISAWLSSPRYHIRLDGETVQDRKQIQAEIDGALQLRLDNLFETMPDLSSRTRSKITTWFYRNISRHGTYLWMHLVFDVIRTRDPDVDKSWDEVFQIAPGKIAEAYNKLLDSIEPRSRQDIEVVFALILAAQRPLSLEELGVAFKSREYLNEGQSRDIYADLETGQFGKWLLKQCGSFIFFNEGKVYLTHRTARDFLMGTTDRGDSKAADQQLHWEGRLNNKDIHRYMTESCVSLLSLVQLHRPQTLQDLCGNQRKDHDTSQQPQSPFVAYSVRHWLDHFKRSQSQIGVSPLEISDLGANFVQAYQNLFTWKEGKNHKRHGEKKQTWYRLMIEAQPAGCLPDDYPTANSIRRLFPDAYNIARTACLFGHLRLLKIAIVNLGLDNRFLPGAFISKKTKGLIDPSFSLAHFAAYGGSDLCLQYLQSKGYDIGSPNSTGQTPIHTAAARGLPHTVETLIRLGVDPLQQDASGKTPLSFAMTTSAGRSSLVGLLAIIHNATLPQSPETVGVLNEPRGARRLRSLLYYAVAAGPSDEEMQSREYKKMLREIRLRPRLFRRTSTFTEAYNKSAIQVLKTWGADLNLPLHQQRTALHLSVVEPRLLCNAAFLLYAGANVHAIDIHGDTPLHLATRAGNYTAINLLTGYGARVNQRGAMPEDIDGEASNSVDLKELIAKIRDDRE